MGPRSDGVRVAVTVPATRGHGSAGRQSLSVMALQIDLRFQGVACGAIDLGQWRIVFRLLDIRMTTYASVIAMRGCGKQVRINMRIGVRVAVAIQALRITYLHFAGVRRVVSQAHRRDKERDQETE